MRAAPASWYLAGVPLGTPAIEGPAFAWADHRDTPMSQPPDVRPVGDLPDAIGRTAARVLALNGISSLEQVAEHSKRELLAIHGVGPKAIAILGDALTARGLRFTEP